MVNHCNSSEIEIRKCHHNAVFDQRFTVSYRYLYIMIKAIIF